jgi:hypothetical protein
MIRLRALVQVVQRFAWRCWASRPAVLWEANMGRGMKRTASTLCSRLRVAPARESSGKGCYPAAGWYDPDGDYEYELDSTPGDVLPPDRLGSIPGSGVKRAGG